MKIYIDETTFGLAITDNHGDILLVDKDDLPELITELKKYLPDMPEGDQHECKQYYA